MNIMDHEQAMKMHAAERYLLDELSPEERNDFEEHYFTCVQCADEVRAVFTFADNAKAVFENEPREIPARAPAVSARPVSSWFAWLRPAFAMPLAAAALLCITVYQSAVVIPRLQRGLANMSAAQVIPSVVARPATRGEDPVVRISPGDRFVQLLLDINPLVPVSSYTCEVYDGSRSLRFSVPANAPAEGGSLNLLLPVSGLKPDRYTIRLVPRGSADSRTEPHVDEYSFVLQQK